MKKDIHNTIFIIIVLMVITFDKHFIKDEAVTDIISMSGFFLVVILFIVRYIRFGRK